MDIRKIAVLMSGYDVGAGINTYYPLDEGGGIQVEDFSQYANHGILKNGPIWGIVDGVVGLTFDGVNDYIEDSKGRHIVKEGTTGFWSEVKIGDETKIVGTGTIFYFYTDYYDGSWHGQKIEGKFVEDFAEHCTALTTFHCDYNTFSGTLPSFSACTALNYFNCDYNTFSGTLPSFSACTALNYFNCYYNTFSGYAAGGFATQPSLATLDFSANALTVAADINAILADLRTSFDLPDRVACTVKLEGGTNAAPTGQGITDKTFLNANGWTVTTN